MESTAIGVALARFEIPVPPLPELRRVVKRIEELLAESQRLDSIHERRRAAKEELKKSLLHQAFSGEL